MNGAESSEACSPADTTLLSLLTVLLLANGVSGKELTVIVMGRRQINNHLPVTIPYQYQRH